MKNSTFLLSLRYLIAIALGGAVLVPVYALAQVNATTNATAQATVTGAPVSATTDTSASMSTHADITGATSVQATVAARAKTKADQEIDRRVAALNALNTRVQAMTKVTDTLKQNLNANIKLELDSFTALKAKIDADTDLAVLKTDIKSVTDSYRIFMLVIPQGRIAAAADRMATIINMFIADGAKLQARIQAAQTAGNDVTALTAALTDLGTQLNAAQTHAQAAVNVTAPLTPDNGDKTKMAANDAALKQARTDLEAGHQDLVVARKDMQTIINGLKTMKASATTTSSSSVQTQ